MKKIKYNELIYGEAGMGKSMFGGTVSSNPHKVMISADKMEEIKKFFKEMKLSVPESAKPYHKHLKEINTDYLADLEEHYKPYSGEGIVMKPNKAPLVFIGDCHKSAMAADSYKRALKAIMAEIEKCHIDPSVYQLLDAPAVVVCIEVLPAPRSVFGKALKEKIEAKKKSLDTFYKMHIV